MVRFVVVINTEHFWKFRRGLSLSTVRGPNIARLMRTHFIRTYGKAKMNTPFSTIWDLLEYVESYN